MVVAMSIFPYSPQCDEDNETAMVVAMSIFPYSPRCDEDNDPAMVVAMSIFPTAPGVMKALRRWWRRYAIYLMTVTLRWQ